ncbi:MAG: hypothetical protein ABJN69_09840 [Hellea sp.]
MLTILSLGLSVQSVWANPITTIDFRDGITEEKINKYHNAVFGGPDNEASSKLIKLLISADKGFDAGLLKVPKQRRILRVNVVIYTFRGPVINAPIRVNLYELDSQSIKHINLEVSLR